MRRLLLCMLALIVFGACFFSCSEGSADTNGSGGENSDRITDTDESIDTESDLITDTDTEADTGTDTDTEADSNVSGETDYASLLKFDLINEKTEYAVIGSDKTAVKVIIPSEYEGKPVTVISSWAFSQNKVLESVIIPDSVREINETSFSNCDALKTVEIPNSVELIGLRAFFGCISLEEIKIGSGVKTIEREAFDNCKKLQNIFVDGNNASYTSYDGNLYTKDKKTLIKYAEAKAQETFTVPESVEIIGYGAFSNSCVKNVIINETVKEIKQGAFAYSAITEIEIPSSIEIIKNGTFEFCTHLTKAAIPVSVKEIESYAFINCYALREIVIPEGVTKIGKGAFEFCKSLKRAVIPKTVTDIEKYTFRLAPVEEVEAPAVALKAFTKTSLKKVKVNGGEMIEANEFKEAHLLETVELCDSVKKICNRAFNMCYELKSINLESVTVIGDFAFDSCYKLNGIALSKELTEIGEWAFCSCKALEKVVLPKTLTKVGRVAFSGCSALIIYCEGDEMQGLQWESGWNGSDRPVIWEHIEE